MTNQSYESVSGNVLVKHPTENYNVETKFTEDATILIVTYSNGIIVERHEYKDENKPTTITSPNGKFVLISENEAIVVKN